jgi:hypothetical protein
MGTSPTKRPASAITCAAGGAAATIALVMPVSCVMNEGMRTPAFIRLWNRSTTRPPSIITIATSVARSPIAGEMPVVSKSMTAMRVMQAAAPGRPKQGQPPRGAAKHTQW